MKKPKAIDVTIVVTISGPPKSGKSMIAAYLEKKLKAFGVEVKGEPSDLTPEAQARRDRDLEKYLAQGIASRIKVIIKTRRAN
jgi:pantothenate kinase-related protein Tda10